MFPYIPVTGALEGGIGKRMVGNPETHICLWLVIQRLTFVPNFLSKGCSRYDKEQEYQTFMKEKHQHF